MKNKDNKRRITSDYPLYINREKNWQLRRVRIIKEYIAPSFSKLLEYFLRRLRRPWLAIRYRIQQFIGKKLNRRSIPWTKLAILALFLYVSFRPGPEPYAETSPEGIRNISMVQKNSVAPAFVSDIKDREVKAYVKRFGKVAVQEMEEYGIPASIKMAQGLIESHSGNSRLARESNNHFGIKCRRKCRGCTCRNYSDDDIYDMFRVFDSAWESWREHSLLLANTQRYQKLQSYGKDYKKWARGLKAAGYATDPKYDLKLIRIIEKYRLNELDHM